MRRASLAIAWMLAGGCVRGGTVGVIASETETGAATLGDDGGSDVADDGTLLDLPDGDFDACIDRGPMMGVGPCMQEAPPDAFVAAIQWSWTGPDGNTDTRVIPLVANITDDNDDGVIDLCDIPDVIVTAGPPPEGNPTTEFPPEAFLYALDGATGTLHWRSDATVRAQVTPALADIDDDGEIEIVALQAIGPSAGTTVRSRVIAFNADGTTRWISSHAFEAPSSDAIAIADLDLDGMGEIMVADRVFDARGMLLFIAPDVAENLGEPLMPFAVDLDGDDDLEVLWSRGAYHHDGSLLFANPDLRHGYVHVANLDATPEPEIVITTERGLSVLAPDGTLIVDGVTPAGPAMGEAWRRPAAIHDIDGDRRPELLIGLGATFHAFRLDVANATLESVYAVPIEDPSGSAAGTAFDFLGDGSAEAMFADERLLYVYESARQEPALTAARSSVTVQEYPVVVDVDNDGSAEVIVGSNRVAGGTADPTIRVFGEASNRWVPARRIWNQHTYHVTNVTESGALPTPEPHHWERTNTFRTNAQIEGGVICLPEP